LSLPDGLFAPHELVRQLGARHNPLYALRQSGVGIGGKSVLAVAERYEGAAEARPGGEDLARDARRIATLASPNLARVRDVVVRGPDLVVIGEFVEGEKLQEVWRPDKLPLEIALRVIVDVLAGVGALHNLRDAKQQPMKLAHGELSPATIVLGLDGIGRVLHSVSRRVPDVEPEPASWGYLSPEVASGDPYDARADVFSAGVLLWEALSEKPLFPGTDPDANAGQVRSGALPRATVSEKHAWARGLAEVAAKALSAAPDERWPTAAVMAAELRKAAGLKLAPASTAAAFARSAFGERVRARRESLDAGSPRSAAPAPAPAVARSPAPAPAVARSPAPPQVQPSRPESSFLEVELESAVDTVLVVPGIRAPVSEVVELESDLLVESSSNSSLPPPASPPTVGGFVLDPFAAPAASVKPQPPLGAMRFTPPRAPAFAPAPAFVPAPAPAPAVAVAPFIILQDNALIEEPPPPSITGAPHFAAAIDVRPSLPAAIPAPYVTPPREEPAPFEAPAQEAGSADGGARRRKVLVLGSVAALGLVVFALAAVRLAKQAPDVTPATLRPPATTASAAQPPPPPPVSAAAPPVIAPTSAPPPVPLVTATAVATAVATPPVVAQTTTAHAPPVAAKPVPVPVAAAAPTHPPPAAQATAAAKPRPKPTFDPNSL
jgi:serine/threonine-protein kinase